MSDKPAAPTPYAAWWERVQHLWHGIIEPTADVSDPDARHQARLLTALLAVLLPLLTGAISYWMVRGLVDGYAGVWDSLAGISTLILLAALYWFSRTRHHRRVAQLTVVAMSLGVFLTSLPTSEYPRPTDMHAYFVLVVLFSSLVLRPRTTLVLILVQMGGMLLYTVVFDDVHVTDLWLSFVGLNSVAILTGTAYVQRLNRKRQAALAANEARMRALLGTFPDLIFRMNVEGVFLDYQTANPDQLYVPPEEFVGRRVIDVMPPEIAQVTLARIKRTLETGQMQISEYALVKDGRTYWSEARSVPLGDNDVLTVVRDITERKIAEHALDRSEEKHQALLGAIPDLIFRLNRQGIFLDYQASKMDMVVPPDQFIGRPIGEVLPQIAEQSMRVIALALETNETQVYEYQLVADGELHDYESRVSPSSADEVVIMVRDVTVSKRAQVDLRTSEARYRNLFDHSLNGFALHEIVLDEDGTPVDYVFLEVNAAFEAHTGIHGEAVLGKRVTEVIPGIRASGLIGIYGKVALTGIPARFQHYVKQLERHFDIAVFSPQRGQFATIFTDVTDREQAAAAVRESEERYRMLFEESPIALWEEDFSAVKERIDALWAEGVTDLAAHFNVHPELVREYAQLVQVVNVNQATLAIFGLASKDALLGDLTTVLEDERALDLFRGELLAFARGKRHYRVESVQTTPDGTVIDAIVTATIAPEHTDTWARVYVSMVDVNEQKRAQAAEHEQRTLAEALREITSLLTSTLDPEQVLDDVLTLIGRVVPYEAANIALLDGDVARVVRSQGYETYDLTTEINATVMKVADFPTLQTMIATREPLLIADTAADPRWSKLEPDRVMRSHVGVPIYWEDQVAGFIALQSSEINFFTPAHAERLQAFASQVAVALRNAQLYRSVQRHVNELETLQRATLDITSQLQLDRVLHMLSEHVLQLINAPAGGIYLHRPEDDELEWVVTVGQKMIAPGARLKRGEGLSGKAWEQRKTLIVNNYHTWSGRHTAYDDQGLIYDAVLAVPILWQGRVLGVINAAADPTQRTFTPHDAQLVELLATQAAIAIQNARLFAAEHEQRTLSDTLRTTIAALNHTLDVDTVMERLLIAVARVVPHDAANIMLLEGGEAMIVHHRGYEAHGTAEWIDQLRIPLNKLMMQSVQNSQSFIVTDTRTDPEWVPNPQSTWIRAILSAPIRIEGEVMGMLNLDSATPNHFTERHLLHTQAFADQAALAIRNARLYAEVRQHRDHLEHTVTQRTADLSLRNKVAETLSSSLDLDEMLYGVLHVVVQRLGVRGGAIYLTEENGVALQLIARHGVTPGQLAQLDPNQAGTPQAMSVVAGDFSADSEDTPAESAVILGTDVSDSLPLDTVLSIPIWRKEQIEGLIMLVHDQPREWLAAEKEMLDAVGRQIGIALANARSFMEAVQGEARIRTILQSVAEGLLVFDHDSHLLLMNPAATAMLAFYPEAQGGPTRAAVLLWSWLRAHNSDTAAHVEFQLPITPLPQADYAAIQAKCEVRHCPLTRAETVGWPCWLQVGGPKPNQVRQCALYHEVQLQAIQAKSAEVRDVRGRTVGTVIALHDVTYFRELDELKGRFVSTVSHELRTPLSTILLQVSTLMKYYDRFDETERRSMIKEMQEQSQVLRDLIEDILELSRFDARKSQPNKQWFDLVATCHEVLGALELAIAEKNLTLTLDGLRGSRYVMGDPNQIARVLRNLANNAIKYTPPGGTITLRMRQIGTDITLAVSDTGIGMTPDEVAHVFDRFYRAAQAIRMASGTGLGLAISKEIIDLHNGQIEALSTPGEGSTFTVTLPIGGLDLLDDLDLPMS